MISNETGRQQLFHISIYREFQTAIITFIFYNHFILLFCSKSYVIDNRITMFVLKAFVK